jgi:hypothetical protein
MGELGACKVEVGSALDIPVKRTYLVVGDASLLLGVAVHLAGGGAMMGVVCKS